MRKKITRISEDYHHIIHWLVGVFVGVTVYHLIPDLSFTKVLFSASLGAILPDLDHFVFFYLYGRQTDYARLARKYISNGQLKKFIKFAKTNHKKNFSVYSHNIFTIIALLLISLSLKSTEHFYITVFLLSCAFHYTLDIVEDIFYFGKINPNWVLKFDRNAKDLEEF